MGLEKSATTVCYLSKTFVPFSSCAPCLVVAKCPVHCVSDLSNWLLSKQIDILFFLCFGTKKLYGVVVVVLLLFFIFF